MLIIQIDGRGVMEVSIVAVTKAEQDQDFLVWPAIKNYIQKINEILENGEREGFHGEDR